MTPYPSAALPNIFTLSNFCTNNKEHRAHKFCVSKQLIQKQRKNVGTAKQVWHTLSLTASTFPIRKRRVTMLPYKQRKTGGMADQESRI
jgi:hypothetical protein